MSPYQRALGIPFVYNQIRPFVTGGIDMSPLYGRLDLTDESVVLDIGCGTGDALRYFDRFARYVGVDTDEGALDFARNRHRERRNATFECRRITAADVEEIAPTHVIMAGLIHHLTDDETVALCADVRRSPRLERVVTQDIVYLSGKWISNLLAFMDRGRFCRRHREYEALVARGGFDILRSDIVRCHPRTGRAWYLMMTLEPKANVR
jgi:SAM-dependent methyltransferase